MLETISGPVNNMRYVRNAFPLLKDYVRSPFSCDQVCEPVPSFLVFNRIAVVAVVLYARARVRALRFRLCVGLLG